MVVRPKAIVIDREFMGEEYQKVKTMIEEYMTYAKRDIFKHGGVNVQYYSWTSINVKRDVTAILSIASCTDTWRLFEAAEDEHLLHMAISESDCPRLPPNKAVTIPLLKRGEEMAQLLLDFRTAGTYKWNSIALIYDDIISRDMVTRIITSLTKESAKISVKPAALTLMKLEVNSKDNKRTAIYERMAQVSSKVVGGNFLVLISYNLVETMMEVAKSLQLVDALNQWLYVIADIDYNEVRNVSRLNSLLKEGDNVSFLYNDTVIATDCQTGVECHVKEILAGFSSSLDAAIQDEFEIASQVSDEEWEAIRPRKVERRDYLLQKVKTYLRINGKCDNCTSWRILAGETWGREYQLNITSETVTQLLPVGNWRPIDGAFMTDQLFLHIAQGFRGKNLPFVSFHNPPWQIINTNETGAITEYRGLVFDIVRELAASLNFTFSVEVTHSGNNVTRVDTNSSFNPTDLIELDTLRIPPVILEMVRNKTVAIGACAFTISEKSKRFVKFTDPISTQSYTFLVARPKELSRALLFMSPFTGDTWLCLTAAIICMGPTLYYIHKYSPVNEHKGIIMKGGLSSIQNCIWYMYGALLQQGGMHLPQADSARVIVGAWWLVVLVVATTYCGNLVAFLTFPKIDRPITIVDDLLAQRDTVSWSIAKDSFLLEELKDAPEWKYKTLYSQRRRVNDDMIARIKEGKHVFIDWKIRLQYLMKKQYLETDNCDFALGLDEFYDEQLALIMANDSPYMARINNEIKKLHQVGLIHKWLKDYLPKRDKCWKNRNTVEVNNHTVNMDDMQGSFFVLFLGFMLSLILILGEKLWFRYVANGRKHQIRPFAS